MDAEKERDVMGIKERTSIIYSPFLFYKFLNVKSSNDLVPHFIISTSKQNYKIFIIHVKSTYLIT